MIDEMQIEDFLSHHGVKGQKWGFRNTITLSGRTHVRNDRHQSRAARNIKRGAAFILGGGPIGLVAYNAISAPLNKKSTTKMNKKTQSGAAYMTKLIATGVLATPLTAVAYAQSAKKVRNKGVVQNLQRAIKPTR